MEKQIIWRGLLAGAVAGVGAFAYARIFVQPVIDRAITYEEAGSHGHGDHSHGGHGGHDHGVELFSRGVQANIGMGFGLLLFALAMGALFAVVFCVAYGRIGDISVRLLSVLTAGAMLVSLYLVPALKYPPSPPALSIDETIRQRTLLHVLLVVLSAALLVAAVVLGRRLTARFDTWTATLLAGGGYLVAVAVVLLVLPSINETPGDFPADVLYDFRLHALITQIVLWTAIALVFAPMAARVLGEHRSDRTNTVATG
ncbi:CbtA family protein [Mycolicibacterium thermoresistibile]